MTIRICQRTFRKKKLKKKEYEVFVKGLAGILDKEQIKLNLTDKGGLICHALEPFQTCGDPDTGYFIAGQQ